MHLHAPLVKWFQRYSSVYFAFSFSSISSQCCAREAKRKKKRLDFYDYSLRSECLNYWLVLSIQPDRGPMTRTLLYLTFFKKGVTILYRACNVLSSCFFDSLGYIQAFHCNFVICLRFRWTMSSTRYFHSTWSLHFWLLWYLTTQSLAVVKSGGCMYGQKWRQRRENRLSSKTMNFLSILDACSGGWSVLAYSTILGSL